MSITSRIVPPGMAAFLVLIAAGAHRAEADALTDQMAQLAKQQNVTVALSAWKFHQPDVAGGERPVFDDSAWQSVAPGFQWSGENSQTWFRTRFVVPDAVNGIPTGGAQIRFEAGMDDDAEIYVNGARVVKFHWDDGHVVLAEHARPGQVFLIALRGINGPGQGGLHFARVVYDTLGALQPAYASYIQEAQFVSNLTTRAASSSERAAITAALKTSETQVNLKAIRNRNWNVAGAGLAAARKTLLSLAPITHQYDVYYVGHAHIDMNWLWPWTETIDVCHRTWDSALNLMDAFPDFGFVQSQPGAYTPIQQQFPAEFARMQAAQKRGQWDPVGGLWDESDTNMPSGEALARSLFLGQRYFKANFGRYATTGWLPDSFGHSWQMPQLFHGAGIDSFYHMRCGDEIPFAWWQSPDGSRVLKANTDSYDEAITPDQLLRPFSNFTSDGLKQALVVFGVGDHGGGPTRDQILAGKGLQADQLYPKVHFTTADSFFRQLHSDKATGNLPVVDSDLQYVFTGCYTTHADLKKAVRDSENNLYSAEVFSSLAAMNGVPYPVQSFEEAWKPTVFAQFHDIMCGSAIHSTYEWMHDQLGPAFAFEQTQTDQSLAAITQTVDTRASKLGERPVVVWNALSFSRSDMVMVTVGDVSQYASARDATGRLTPVQALDSHSLCFIARDVPALGQRTYWLSSEPVPGAEPVPLASETDDAVFLENAASKVTIDKDSGAVTSLFDKRVGRELIAAGASANVFQVLGDSGSAWDIAYTGDEEDLDSESDVRIVANGPVCTIVRVRHSFGASMFTQNVTLYNDLARIDIPTVVDWHEHGQLVKVAFPLSLQHPRARVGIPYGSIDRPTDGQENPGQKWMDVTEERSEATSTPVPVDLTNVFNHRSAGRFDADGRAYPSALMPEAGIHVLGESGIAFRIASATGAADNVACTGQTIPVALAPAAVGAARDRVYLLAAGADSSQGGVLTVIGPGGRRARIPFVAGDWVAGGGRGNEVGATFAYRLSPAGSQEANKTHLWIVPLQLPAGFGPVKQIVLPSNPKLHIFAVTLGSPPKETPVCGLTILNDCKYGSDTNGGVFRLTLLRSSHDPDPDPDEGLQTFTYSLLPHAGDWRNARAEQAGLDLNIPLRAILADAQTGKPDAPRFSLTSAAGGGALVVGALKHAEDGPGYILRLFETQGKDSNAKLTFSQPVRITETDLLERPVDKRKIVTQGNVVTFPVGHDQIVTLHILGLPDGGAGKR